MNTKIEMFYLQNKEKLPIGKKQVIKETGKNAEKKANSLKHREREREKS